MLRNDSIHPDIIWPTCLHLWFITIIIKFHLVFSQGSSSIYDFLYHHDQILKKSTILTKISEHIFHLLESYNLTLTKHKTVIAVLSKCNFNMQILSTHHKSKIF